MSVHIQKYLEEYVGRDIWLIDLEPKKPKRRRVLLEKLDGDDITVAYFEKSFTGKRFEVSRTLSLSDERYDYKPIV